MKRINLKRFFLLLGGTLFCFSISNASYGQSLSFSEALRVMNEENSLIKAMEKQEEVHQYEWKAMKGLRSPTVKAFGMGLYMDRSLGLDFNGLRNQVGDFVHLPNAEVLGNWSVDFNKRDMAFGGFMATWPIFTGGKINAAVQAGKLKSEIGEKELEQTKDKLLSELVVRYYTVKLAERALIVRQDVLAGMKKHQDDALKLEEQGMIAPVQRMAADVAVSDASRELDAAKKDATLARLALANTMEVEEVTSDLSSDFFVLPQMEALDYYQHAAAENYPALQKLSLQKELATQGVKAKQAANYPTVVAFGQTVLAHNNPISGLDVLYDNNKPWTVGIGVTYTLFEGLRNRNEIKAAKATRESVALFEEKAKSDIKMLVAKLYQDIQKQQEQLDNLTTQEAMATEYLRVRNKAFIEGFATSTEVVDAELNLSAVKLKKLQAHFYYVSNVASLFEYTGLSNEFVQFAK
ncbi:MULTISPECIES: TolC family protein [unclassified Myroides]|uniref:TolC family protein n=1 Tax=unclassified Myroides TaxID=2642485 RepID=UPI0015F90ED1|nr:MULTISPECIES: TolC family protein [unclassified Myroides]MBB1150853.1 TolC family protein [Myroides sp. NP-2]MDM1407805.1 TolC family protein [Myroides sp. DF42-4-2]